VGETTAASSLVPLDWLPSAPDLTYAAEHRPDLGHRLPTVTQKFIQDTRARGQHFADISAAWRCWVLRERASHDHDRPIGRRPHADRLHTQPVRTELAARNRDTARDCLERVLARRGNHQSA
jgi:hypothetical protein